jgi:hypothetical protein
MYTTFRQVSRLFFPCKYNTNAVDAIEQANLLKV